MTLGQRELALLLQDLLMALLRDLNLSLQLFQQARARPRQRQRPARPWQAHLGAELELGAGDVEGEEEMLLLLQLQQGLRGHGEVRKEGGAKQLGLDRSPVLYVPLICDPGK